jgi:hypothetical protein
LVTDTPLREFDEQQRKAISIVATLFDKLALIMAEVETLGERGEERRRRVCISTQERRYWTMSILISKWWELFI